MIGTVYFTTDHQIATNAICQQKNTCILDLNDMGSILDPNHPQVIQATCLLPPPDALIAECDGAGDMFMAIYEQYLMSDIVVEFVATLLTFLFNNGNLVIFIMNIPEDSVWLNYLLSHLYQYYGLKVGTSTDNPFEYDTNYLSFDAELVYMYNGMSPQMFLSLHQNNIPLNQQIINKLIFDLRLMIPRGTDINAYFSNLKAAYKMPLTNPIQFGGK